MQFELLMQMESRRWKIASKRTFNVFDGMTPFWGILFGWIMLGLKLSSLEWVTLVVSFSAISLIYFSAKE